jgi:hypothetical protein
MITKVRNKLQAVSALVSKYSATEPAMEAVYRELFLRELNHAGLDDVYYPIGSAGNHSMLYIVARCIRQLPVQSVLELGAGESTRLVSHLRGALCSNFEVTTVEHDNAWVQKIQPHVSHPILHAPLMPMAINDYRINYYDPSVVGTGSFVDFLIIDGPPAASAEVRFSRMGSLDIIENRLMEGFIIVIDDVERKGEQALVAGVRSILRRGKCDYREATIRAIKSQFIFASGKLKDASYF